MLKWQQYSRLDNAFPGDLFALITPYPDWQAIISGMIQQTNQPTTVQAWLSAMRPRTLPLAVASIILGGFLAAANDVFDMTVTGLCIITAVFLQILSNLANDYGDSVHGADHVERAGPQRAVQSGLIAPRQMLWAMIIFVLLSGFSGLALLWVAFGLEALPKIVMFIGLGAGAMGAAIAYTNGKRPYGYAGWGDLFVLIFFGWVGTLGTYFLQTEMLPWLLFLPATSVGMLSVGVLNVNNIRDIESDRVAGKMSIPVRLGRKTGVRYHWFLLGTAVLLALLTVVIDWQGVGQLLFLLAVPLLWRNATAVARMTDPVQLNPMLKQLSLSTLAFVVLFGIGQIIG